MPPFKVKSKVNAKEIFQQLDVYQLFTETAELDLITDDTMYELDSMHNYLQWASMVWLLSLFI